MGMVFCSKCGSSDGVLCRACGKPNHFDKTKTGWTGGRFNGCWRQLARVKRRFKVCEGHEAPIAECDSCRIREPALAPARGWNYPRDPAWWRRVETIASREKLILCPSCQGTFRVGLDWALERNGEPPLSESIACAFAFQVGQYCAGATDHRTDAVFTNPEVLMPDFVDPRGWGKFGWGRWSDVRRTAPETADVLVGFSDGELALVREAAREYVAEFEAPRSCWEQGPSGARCSLQLGHFGNHRAGSEDWPNSGLPSGLHGRP